LLQSLIQLDSHKYSFLTGIVIFKIEIKMNFQYINS
jgi:hypothetical protein